MVSLGEARKTIIYDSEAIVNIHELENLWKLEEDVKWLVDVEDVLDFLRRKSYFDHGNYNLVFRRDQIFNAYEEATASFWTAFDKIKERLANSKR